MQRYQAYLHQQLDPIYSLEEIGSFSRLLLYKLANMSSVQIYSDKDRNFPEHIFQELASAIRRLALKEPIQYILGETEFYGLPFHVEPGVLIPRPETEELVDLICADCLHQQKNFHILDIGTGSGCIAISLAKSIPSSILAWDISPEALAIATKNALVNQVSIAFEQVDILSYKPNTLLKETFDILVSNPPYVRLCEIAEMDANVLEHEPHLALFVDDSDPLIYYRTISELALDLLKPEGSLYFEINSYLGKETLELVKRLPFKSVELFKDLSGKDRMIRAKR